MFFWYLEKNIDASISYTYELIHASGGGSAEVEEPNVRGEQGTGGVSLAAIERWREEDQGPEKEGAFNRSKAVAHPATSHEPEWAPR